MKKTTKAFAICALVFGFSSCADFFQEKIPASFEGDKSSLGGLLVPDEKITKLEIPSKIAASQGRYKNKITISWSEVPFATSYHLERAVATKDDEGKYTLPDDSDFEPLNNFIYSTKYEDTILFDPGANNIEYNNIYFYRVCAENISKGYEASEFTDFTVSDYEGKGWLLAPPRNAVATKGSSQDSITVSWDPIEGASYYKIYRGTSNDGSGAIALATVYGNQTSYTNKIDKTNQGVEFFYKLSAMIKTSTSFEESATGTLAMGYALKDGAPSAPDPEKIIVSGYGVTTDALVITWEAKTNESYNIYRNSSTDSVFTCIKNNYVPTSTTATYRDETVSTGQLYYYYIQSLKTNAAGEISKSPFSDTGASSAKPAQGFILSAPTTIDIADGSTDGSVLIRWKPAIGENLVPGGFKYNIKKSPTADGEFIPLLDKESGILDEEGYLTCETPKEPFFRISTFNESVDLESEDSIAVAPQPAAPVNVEASKTKNLAQEMGSDWKYNDYEVYPVRITWNKPMQDNPTSYTIFRSEKPNASFKKVATVMAPDNDPNTVVTYYDSNPTAKAGTFFYYKVVSVNSLGQGKKGNDPSTDTQRKSWGYGAITRDQWFREYNKEIFSSQAKLTLMHKPSDLDKVGSETVYATVPVNGSLGTLGYNAKVAGLGAEISMPYKEYADHYIVSNGQNIGVYFILNGNTDTTSNMSANGHMHETVRCYHYENYNGLFQGMYPGSAKYDNLEIKGGAAGGGYYLVQTYELDYTSANANATVILSEGKVDYLVGEEGK